MSKTVVCKFWNESTMKETIKKSFHDNFEKNYSKYSEYFEFNLDVLCELNTLIFEINKCLILELDRAAITLTNNLTERLLKITLITNEVGIGSIPFEKWNEVFKGPNEKYSSISLGNSIEKCKKLELISQKEKDILFDIIRELLRNGFAHADSTKLLAKLPDETPMFQGDFTKPNEGMKEVKVNQKIIPFFQAMQMEEFAKHYSKEYFDFIFKLIFRIEKRLIEKHK